MTKKEQVLNAVSMHPGKLAGFYEQQVGFVCTAELRQLKNAGALKRTGKRASYQYWLPSMTPNGPATKKRLFSPEKLARLQEIIEGHDNGATVVFRFKSGRVINFSMAEFKEIKGE